jgi:adenine/guanine phosphoribosyltransferase-like PRPP-binding protein
MTTQDKVEFLKQKFLQSAFVKDPKQGYIVVKDFNLAIDPDVLEFASRCWAENYHHNKDIDAIVGLPDAGARLVSILGEMLRVGRVLPSKRSIVVPGAWENVITYSNRSFTTDQEEVVSHIGFVQKGMKIILVDDVVAHGSTAVAAIKALQLSGVEVIGLAVLFDKAWQGGVDKIKRETGIDTFSIISIQEITPAGEIKLK